MSKSEGKKRDFSKERKAYFINKIGIATNFCLTNGVRQNIYLHPACNSFY